MVRLLDGAEPVGPDYGLLAAALQEHDFLCEEFGPVAAPHGPHLQQPQHVPLLGPAGGEVGQHASRTVPHLPEPSCGVDLQRHPHHHPVDVEAALAELEFGCDLAEEGAAGVLDGVVPVGEFLLELGREEEFGVGRGRLGSEEGEVLLVDDLETALVVVEVAVAEFHVAVGDDAGDVVGVEDCDAAAVGPHELHLGDLALNHRVVEDLQHADAHVETVVAQQELRVVQFAVHLRQRSDASLRRQPDHALHRFLRRLHCLVQRFLVLVVVFREHLLLGLQVGGG